MSQFGHVGLTFTRDPYVDDVHDWATNVDMLTAEDTARASYPVVLPLDIAFTVYLPLFEKQNTNCDAKLHPPFNRGQPWTLLIFLNPNLC